MKSAKELLKKPKKKKISIRQDDFSPGELEMITDEIFKDGFMQLPRSFAAKKHFTASDKLVFGCLLDHAWVKKDQDGIVERKNHSFPGKAKVAKETGLSESTVYRSLKALTGANKANEVMLENIHRGHGLTNLYKIYCRMDAKTVEYYKQKRKSKTQS